MTKGWKGESKRHSIAAKKNIGRKIEMSKKEIVEATKFDKAFDRYMRTGIIPSGYYLDKRKYWQGYNHGLSTEDAKEIAFKKYKR